MKAKTAIPYDEMPLRQVELLDAAAHAFTEMGFAATTIDSVADLIGVTKGSVYYYYRSKTDLFFAVHRRAMQLNLDTVAPLAEDEAASPPQRLWNMAHAHTHLMMAHLPYQRVTVQGVELHLAGRTTANQRAELEELVPQRGRGGHGDRRLPARSAGLAGQAAIGRLELDHHVVSPQGRRIRSGSRSHRARHRGFRCRVHAIPAARFRGGSHWSEWPCMTCNPRNAAGARFPSGITHSSPASSCRP
jgi:AcrR family transcriptional regulator